MSTESEPVTLTDLLIAFAIVIPVLASAIIVIMLPAIFYDLGYLSMAALRPVWLLWAMFLFVSAGVAMWWFVDPDGGEQP